MYSDCVGLLIPFVLLQKKAAEKREQDVKKDVIQCDDLLTFRQFSKKAADDVIDVRQSSTFPFRAR